MARAYGLDLRRRVIEAIDGGISARAAAARFSVGISTSINWHRQWREAGSLEPGRQGKPAGSKLDAHEAFILDLVAAEKDIALHEIAARLAGERDLQTCPATVWHLSRRPGLCLWIGAQCLLLGLPRLACLSPSVSATRLLLPKNTHPVGFDTNAFRAICCRLLESGSAP